MTLRELSALIELKLNADLGPDREPPELVAAPADLALLRSEGLIDADSLVTEKGEAYIRALQAVPLPVQRWVIPEISHAVEERLKPSGGVVEHQDGDGSGQTAKASGSHRAKRRRQKQSTEEVGAEK